MLQLSLLCAVWFLPIVVSHSWLDCIDHKRDVVDRDSAQWVLRGVHGHGECEGYARNYPGRGDRNINTKFTYQLPYRESSNRNICQHSTGNYNSWRKKLQAKAGDKLYFAYFPNGHISKDRSGRNTQYGIYWSGKQNVELKRRSELTPKNVLTGTHEFDDKNCGETLNLQNQKTSRAGNFKPCIGSFEIPETVKSGTYQFVWYWAHYKTKSDNVTPINPREAGSAYTSCFDITILGSSNPKTSGPKTDAPETNAPETDAPRTNAPKTNAPKTKARKTNAPKNNAHETTTPKTTESISNCRGFWESCQKNGKLLPCAIGSTCKKVHSHFSQCIPDTYAFDTQCRGLRWYKPEACPKGWQCKVENEYYGGCTPAANKCSHDSSSENHSSTQTDSPATRKPSTPVSKKTISPETSKPDSPSSSKTEPPIQTTENPMSSETNRPPRNSPTVHASIEYNGVGGKGKYNRVINMVPGEFGKTCPKNKCFVQSQSSEGPLAPFNEDMTMVFRGPMNIYDIGVYEPKGSSWEKVASYEKGKPSNSIVFFNNKGDNVNSGIWTQCGGNSQSFATSDGKNAAPFRTTFNGRLDDHVTVNIMSNRECQNKDCGFYRGPGFHGWKGPDDGEKMFIVKANMPVAKSGEDLPAIWMLNSQIVRTAQFACNCRGDGFFGGCGELDVAEIIKENKNQLTSTIYSFKGSIGFGEYTPRPTNDPVIYVVIFSAENRGKIKILALDQHSLDVQGTTSFSKKEIEDLLKLEARTVKLGN